MKTSRLAPGANPCGATHPCASVSTRPARAERGLSHLAAILFLALIGQSAFGASINLGWDPNPETDIVSYNLSYGTSSGSYSTTLSAGTATGMTVSGLNEGQTYYFVVKAVNSAGLVSAPSAEISYQVPVTTTLPGSSIPRDGWILKSVSSQEPPMYAAALAFDGNPDTFWHTEWVNNSPPPPHEIAIDLGVVQTIGGFRYLPRQDAWNNGNIGQYEFYVSMDGSNWGSPVAAGVFANTKTEKEVLFPSISGRFVKLREISEVNGKPYCNVAELNIVLGESMASPSSPVNQAPVASDQAINTAEDNAVAISLSAADADGDQLAYSMISGPTMGSLSGTAPNLVYTPAVNANGNDSFTFRVNDGKADSNIATVSIAVVAVNDVPAAASQTASTPEDQALGILLSASDMDGDAMTYRIVSGPSKGALSGAAPNLIYTPSADANGTDSFTFCANDGKTDSNTATVSITVTPVNDAPVAVAQATSTLEDKALSIILSSIDKDGDVLSYRIVSSTAKGTLSGTAPNLTYIPNSNVSGGDSFSFVANDGKTDSNIATVSITVTPVNDAPVASAQIISATVGTPVGIVLSASDVDGDALTFSIASSPTQGGLSGTPPNLTYTPAATATGSDSFTFLASDGKLNSNTATISINITSAQKAANSAPVFQADVFTRASGVTNVAYIAESLAGSAVDPDADVVSYSKTAGPAWLVISPDGNLTGTPPSGTEGLNYFTIRASDPSGAFNEAKLEITIQPSAQLPLPWSLARIGSLSQDSTAWGDLVALNIKGTGSLASTADSCVFSWQTLSGDGEIIARVSSLANVNSSSRIGLMIRESLAPNSKHAFIGWDGSSVLRYTMRTKTGGSASSGNFGAGTPSKLWLRLVRASTSIQVFTSGDGLNWKRINKSSLFMASSCYVGLVVSGGATNLSTGVFQNVTVKP